MAQQGLHGENMKLLAATVIAGALATSALSAMADETGRLDKIKETGAITLGHPETSVPFAFLGPDQKPIGYSVEICQFIADEIKSGLKLDKLEVRYNPTTSATRIPLLSNGTIDLECGNTTNLVARHEFVSFAPTTFVSKVVLVARKDGGVDVNDPSSFRGKSIAGQAGGEDFRIVSRLNAFGNYGYTVTPTNDTAQTFLMVESGRAAAAVDDDALAYSQVALAKHPDDFVIGTKALAVAPYGIMEPKDDPAFKKAVDDAVLKAIKTGKVQALYDKYFNSPLPPSNVNLKFPMSDVLHRALENPSDSGDPTMYK